jgi:hypothetical protein
MMGRVKESLLGADAYKAPEGESTAISSLKRAVLSQFGGPISGMRRGLNPAASLGIHNAIVSSGQSPGVKQGAALKLANPRALNEIAQLAKSDDTILAGLAQLMKGMGIKPNVPESGLAAVKAHSAAGRGMTRAAPEPSGLADVIRRTSGARGESASPTSSLFKGLGVEPGSILSAPVRARSL